MTYRPTFRFIACIHALLCSSAPAALWTDGHGDFTLGFTASPVPSFSYQWVVGTGGDPASVDGGEFYDTTYSSTGLTPVVSATRVTSPNPALTGAALLHLVPQDGTDAALLGSPFQGWSSGVIPGGLFTGNQVRLQLTAVAGPGAVSLWSDNGFGGTTFFWASANGITTSDSLPLFIGGHSHFNLGFTLPGDYVLHVMAQGTLIAGTSVASPLTLQYRVIPEASSSALILGSATLLPFRLRRRNS
jgi:surface-anchored protein